MGQRHNKTDRHQGNVHGNHDLQQKTQVLKAPSLSSHPSPVTAVPDSNTNKSACKMHCHIHMQRCYRLLVSVSHHEWVVKNSSCTNSDQLVVPNPVLPHSRQMAFKTSYILTCPQRSGGSSWSYRAQQGQHTAVEHSSNQQLPRLKPIAHYICTYNSFCCTL